MLSLEERANKAYSEGQYVLARALIMLLDSDSLRIEAETLLHIAEHRERAEKFNRGTERSFVACATLFYRNPKG